MQAHFTSQRRCTVAGCDRPSYQRGWCNMHYGRWYRHGSFENPRLSAEARFWSKVNKAGPVPPHRPELGHCWVWIEWTNRDGYGRFWLNGRQITASRAAWEFANGAVPEGMNVCHRCDNPPCVRADHLFIGDDAANMADKIAKGRDVRGDQHNSRLHPETLARGERHGRHTHPERTARGERQAGAKLRDPQIREIRSLCADGVPTKLIAARYGVSMDTIRLIAKRKHWAHVSD